MTKIKAEDVKLLTNTQDISMLEAYTILEKDYILDKISSTKTVKELRELVWLLANKVL